MKNLELNEPEKELMVKYEILVKEITELCLRREPSAINLLACAMAIASVAAIAIKTMEHNSEVMEIFEIAGTTPQEHWEESFKASLDRAEKEFARLIK